MLFGIGQATQLDSKKESGWDERPDLLSEIGVFLSYENSEDVKLSANQKVYF
ncbi:hypothetical protein SAMN03080617_00218 [Algoriphagus alkaliphilus]|uniref:Uncharacterized protein n=1 Tax=Algoriphagus alkaliphilus TaxID=279824 RepID=A0A1G5UZH8_9BACT|nr:hypothetical protein [Algoriphagus alkaliphilus]SDA39022.1 hypothetical protein SAMN03080617_00218 [Algoriphagus alkaliphilus]